MANAIRQTLAAALALLFIATSAMGAQSDRLQEGDLVQFSTANGPVIGEVLSGPDPSRYYLLAIPGQENFAIHGERLLILQRAGAANAAIEVNAAVRWTQYERTWLGSVSKVNGAWCRVQSNDQALLGWIECASLKSVQSF